MTLIRLLLAIAFIVFAIQSKAQPMAESMHFTVHDPCGGGNADYCAGVLVGRGVFDGTTLVKFKLAIEKNRRTYNLTAPMTGISTVIFSSPGGSLSAGIAVGKEIRRLKLTTTAVRDFNEYIPSKRFGYVEKKLLQNATCLSACAYAFLGGSKRTVENDNVLGVHQFRSLNSTETLESDAQMATAQLSIYVTSMGVSPNFMNIASLTRPHEITYLGVNDSMRLKVDNVKVSLADWSIAATTEGTPLLTVSQQIADALTIKITMLLDGHRLLVKTATILDVNETRSDRLNVFPDDQIPTISFFVDGKEFKGAAVGKWEKTIRPGLVIFTSISTFSPNMLIALQGAKSISISDDFGHASQDLSLTTDLSSVGLKSGAALLFRSK